jgi:hypothetical protein
MLEEEHSIVDVTGFSRQEISELRSQLPRRFLYLAPRPV